MYNIKVLNKIITSTYINNKNVYKKKLNVYHYVMISKKTVYLRSLLVILVFENGAHVLHLLRPDVGALLVVRQIIVRKLALQMAHALDELLVALLQGGKSGVVVLDVDELLVEAGERVP